MTRRITSASLRRLLLRAAAGEDVEYLVSVRHTKSTPRLFASRTDFRGVTDDGWYGCYIIYSPRRRLGASAIAYIGKGWVGARGEDHLRTKPDLRRLSAQTPLKYIVSSWSDIDDVDEDAAWLFEQIMLKEHDAMYGTLPAFNTQPWTVEVEAWRRVLRWSPGPRKLLAHYGG